MKVLEAAAMGKPIVTTSLGVEGLEFDPNRNIVIADSPTLFADAVLGLLGASERQKELGSNARRTSLRYDWEKFEIRLCELVEEVMLSKNAISHR